MAETNLAQTTKPTNPSSIIEPYSADVYNTVTPSLSAAIDKFTSRDIQPIINTQIRSCFLNHHVEDKFSACLIHRHFSLSPSERNVESEGKAIASSDLTNLHASSWMFFEGKCYPYEFKRYAVASPPLAFIEELEHVLRREGLCDLIGFQVYTDGVVGLESTENHVSTTVDQDERLPVPEGMAAASWAFFRE